MQRKRPFLSPERRSVPRRVRAEIMVRQQGRYADCGTRLIMGFIVFDHRPPIRLRDASDDVSDPDRLAAICWTCHERKTPKDLRSIAKAKRIAEKHQDFLERQADKVPGRCVPSRKERQQIERMIGMQPRRGLDEL
jgi:cytochrome c553